MADDDPKWKKDLKQEVKEIVNRYTVYDHESNDDTRHAYEQALDSLEGRTEQRLADIHEDRMSRLDKNDPGFHRAATLALIEHGEEHEYAVKLITGTHEYLDHRFGFVKEREQDPGRDQRSQDKDRNDPGDRER